MNIKRVNVSFIRFEGEQVRGPGLIVQTDLIQLYKELEAMGRVGGYIYFDNSDGGRIGFNLSRFDQYTIQILPPEEEKTEPVKKFDIEGKVIEDANSEPTTDGEAVTNPGPTLEPAAKV